MGITYQEFIPIKDKYNKDYGEVMPRHIEAKLAELEEEYAIVIEDYIIECGTCYIYIKEEVSS